jgi:hypothetical protein
MQQSRFVFVNNGHILIWDIWNICASAYTSFCRFNPSGIDGERYLIPSVYKDGKLVSSIENRIKLPIEITSGFYINRRSDYNPPKSMFNRFLYLFY